MSATRAAQEVVQERRLVTVLFADIVGFTSLAETLDPEELQELMSDIFQSLVRDAERYEGTVEKFIGDAIFVVFGAPVAHEDDPERALRTALAMQRTFAQHAAVVRSRYGRELSLRIGVHTGIVIAGQVRDASEYGVMGDTVNTAARLQERAQPGEILVTQATFRLTNQRFSFREVGPVQMKGKEQAVLAYALTGEYPVARPSVELNTPLVGRWMELSRLDLAFQSAIVGRTEFVAVSGEPGIGKSRLANEFLGLLETAREEGGESPLVLRWTYSGVGVRSYAGFVETLFEAFGFDRTAANAKERLDQWVDVLEPPNHDIVHHELAVFLGLKPAPPESGDVEEVKRRRYSAIRDTYAALTRARPVVLVLEDLHNADSATLELLGFMLAHPVRARLLVLLTYRALPDALTKAAPRANFTSLVLDPLSPEESSRIVESVLQWVPEALRDLIVERSGGNPFFIEETLRSLIDAGIIVREAEGWRLVREPEQLDVPATLHAVVAARIDRLPPLARECIQYAAVIGPRFGYRVLVAAAGQEVADAVDQLIDAELVVVAGPAEGRIGRYRFRHAVTQEVAYQTLLVRRRTEMHRRVAEAIERVYAKDLTDLYPTLAHHYALGEVPGRAAEYAERAATVALENHAHGEALRYAEQAAALFERESREEDALRTLMLVGLVQRYRGEDDAAIAAYQRALAIAERIDPTGAPVRELYAAIAETSTRWSGKLPDLDRFIERGLALCGPDPTRERALLLAAKAFSMRRKEQPARAEWEAALETAREALAIAESLGALREVSLCLDAVGYAERELGRFADALHTHQRRIPIARTLRESDELIDALTMVAGCEQVLDAYRDAIEHGREARELAKATGKDALRLSASAEEAKARLLASDFEGALSIGRELASEPPHNWSSEALAMAIASAAAMSDPIEQDLSEKYSSLETPAAAVAGMHTLAAFYAMRSGEQYLADLLELPTETDRVWTRHVLRRVIFLPTLALAAARWGARTTRLVDLADATVRSSGHRRGAALIAHARAVQGRDDAALERVIAEYAALGLAFEEALGLYDLAILRAREAREDVDPLLRRARATAERIGAEALAASLRV
jgi:adenylate cyclase